MANNNSAKKRIRQNITRRLRNRSVKSRVRTIIKSFDEAVNSADKTSAESAYKAVVKELDSATGKGVFHKNTAARKKSRLAKVLASVV